MTSIDLFGVRNWFIVQLRNGGKDPEINPGTVNTLNKCERQVVSNVDQCVSGYLSPGNCHLKNAVPVELDSVRLPVGGVDEYPGDVSVHGDVEVWPVSYGPQECFGCATAAPSANGSLQIHKYINDIIYCLDNQLVR